MNLRNYTNINSTTDVYGKTFNLLYRKLKITDKYNLIYNSKYIYYLLNNTFPDTFFSICICYIFLSSPLHPCFSYFFNRNRFPLHVYKFCTCNFSRKNILLFKLFWKEMSVTWYMKYIYLTGLPSILLTSLKFHRAG